MLDSLPSKSHCSSPCLEESWVEHGMYVHQHTVTSVYGGCIHQVYMGDVYISEKVLCPMILLCSFSLSLFLLSLAPSLLSPPLLDFINSQGPPVDANQQTMSPDQRAADQEGQGHQ